MCVITNFVICRDEIAGCSEKAYDTLSVADARQMLLFSTDRELSEYINEVYFLKISAPFVWLLLKKVLPQDYHFTSETLKTLLPAIIVVNIFLNVFPRVDA